MLSPLRDAARRFLPSAALDPLTYWGWRAKSLLAMRKLRRASSPLPPDRRYPPGVNLIGDFDEASGLGESCRILASALKQASIPLALVSARKNASGITPPENLSEAIAEKPLYDTNILHLQPPNLPLVLEKFGNEALDHRYNIAFWLWEQEKFPDEWLPAFRFFEEFWTPSDFVSEAIRRETSRPVQTMPYAIAPGLDREYRRADFGLPEGVFLALCAADFRGAPRRKNPQGAIEAFLRAFPSPERAQDAGLVIKLNRASRPFLKRIQKKLAGYLRIYFITDTLKRGEMNGLIQCCDAFISLHRAEGFGLVLAEAMALGTPCIATNWSANTEFMTSENSLLVNYAFVKTGRLWPNAQKNARHAEPEIDHAASCLKRLADDPALRETISAAALLIRKTLSLEAMSAKIDARLAKITASLPGGGGEQP